MKICSSYAKKIHAVSIDYEFKKHGHLWNYLKRTSQLYCILFFSVNIIIIMTHDPHGGKHGLCGISSVVTNKRLKKCKLQIILHSSKCDSFNI